MRSQPSMWPGNILLVTGSLLVSSMLSFAQIPPNIEWQRAYGGTGTDLGLTIASTRDGHFIIAGHTTSSNGDVSYNRGAEDAWILLIDGDGELLWQYTFGGSSYDSFKSVLATPDSGFIAIGYTASYDGDVQGQHGPMDAWVVKLDTEGSLDWQRVLGSSANDYGYAIQAMGNGGYIFAGSVGTNDGDVDCAQTGPDGWVVRLDGDGEVLWQSCVGTGQYEILRGLMVTSDGGYIVTGVQGSAIWIVKLDENGEQTWDRSLSYGWDDTGTKVKQTLDGGYIISGVQRFSAGGAPCNEPGLYGYIVKLDINGELEWEVTCLGGSDDDRILSIAQTPDGGYLAIGSTGSDDGDVGFNHGGDDAWLVRLDVEGNLLWEKTFGGSGNDYFQDLVPTSDGGYVLVGSTSSADGDVNGNQGGADLWVVKLWPEGVGITEQDEPSSFRLYPNPITDQGHVQYNGPATGKIRLEIYDSTGRLMLPAAHYPHASHDGMYEFDASALLPGIYQLRLVTGDASLVRSFLKME